MSVGSYVRFLDQARVSIVRRRESEYPFSIGKKEIYLLIESLKNY